MSEVKIGQVYRDKDARMYSGKRYLLVTYLHSIGDKADTVQCDIHGQRYESARVYKISRKNLAKRFELIAANRNRAGDERLNDETM